MKKMRKGFTLVELLIVVAILATLSAVMTASITGQTAKAKAAAIMNNVTACKKAAEYYYAAHWDNADDMSETTATTKKVITDYVKNFSSEGKLTDGKIEYAPVATGSAGIDATTGVPKWAITVTFKDDGEAQEIAKVLVNHPGYSTALALADKATEYPTSFKVVLYTGEISANS